MPIDQTEKDALYQEFKTRLAAETPPLPWWQDADKLIKVIGAIGVFIAALGGVWSSIQSHSTATKVEAVQAHQETNSAKLDAVKADAHEAKTEAVKIGAKLNK